MDRGAGAGDLPAGRVRVTTDRAHPLRRRSHRHAEDEADEPGSSAARRLPAVSLSGLLAGGHPDIGGETDATLDHYAREIAASGFPGMRSADSAVRPDLLDGYLDRATDHDLLLMGHRARRPGIVRRWLTAYAAAHLHNSHLRDDQGRGHRRRSPPSRPRPPPLSTATCSRRCGWSTRCRRGGRWAIP